MQLKLAQRRKILTSDNQSFSPPSKQRTGLTRTWVLEPFQKIKVHCPGSSSTESPSLYLTINDQVPKPFFGEHTLQHFHIPALLPYLIKSLQNHWSERQIWALPSIFFLGHPVIKPFIFAKDLWLCIWSFLCAADKESLPGNDIKSDGAGH